MGNISISAWIKELLDSWIPVRGKSEMIANLKRNWYFPISAMAFFCISARLETGYYLAMLIALLLAVLTAAQTPSVWMEIKHKPIGMQAVSVLSALGTCWAGAESFMEAWHISPQTKVLDALLPIPMEMICMIGAVAAAFFVWFYMVRFWTKMTEIVSKNGVFYGISSKEWTAYIILFALVMLLCGYSFLKTEAFYGTAYEYDVIYTADSQEIVSGNAYLTLTHLQNDIRQPLFAVFAAPFLGLPYLIGQLAGGSLTVTAILMNCVQIGMLFAANFMLAKLLGLDSRKRICFMILSCCTYTHLLFSLMMEQYIVAYFWLMFSIYLICSDRKNDSFALCGAGGTLLTSVILLPLFSDRHPIREFKGWLLDMVRCGLEFVAILLIFCRFDVIFNLFASISNLNSFAGHDLTMWDKLCQYVSFVVSCFAAPQAGPNTTFTAEHISWQMEQVTGISIAGVVILALVLVSVVWNRKQKSSRIAGGWVLFSLVMLVGLGWGTAENGLILYALYFGWAFLVLLFQLVEKIEETAKIRWLIPAATICVGIFLLAVNIPAMTELLNFAVTYFPA